MLNALKTLILGKTLYFPGCVTKYKLNNIQKNYEAILKTLNIKYITLKNEFCCGLPALNQGYTQDFERLRHENIQLFKKHNIKKIITNCPACAHMFKQEYNIPTQHITELIPEQDPIEDRGEITLHQPCHQKEPPIDLIKSLGFKPTKCLNQCCGTGHIDKESKLSQKIAENLTKEEKKILTTCPLCYKHMKDTNEETQILELSEVIM
jgi:Fe-S oxidoreductase